MKPLKLLLLTVLLLALTPMALADPTTNLLRSYSFENSLADNVSSHDASMYGASYNASGYIGSGLTTGNGRYAETPSTSLVTSGNVRSVCAWERPISIGGGNTVWGQTATTGQDWAVGFAQTWFTDGVNGNNNQALPYTPNTEEWYHYCWVMTSNSEVLLYVNGALNQTGSMGTTLNTGAVGNASIGQKVDVAFYGDTTHDELHYWTEAISVADVQAVYGNESIGCAYPWGSSTPCGVNNFTITATDAYTAGAISTFNATVVWNGTTTTYTTTTGTITTNIIENTGNANVTVRAPNHYTNTTLGHDTNNTLAATLAPYADTFSTRESDTTIPVTIGNAYGTVLQFDYVAAYTSSAYAAAQIQTNATTGASTAECRINFNGSTYDSTATRSLSANSVGNFYLLTSDFPIVAGGNYTAQIECRKTGGANFVVDNSDLIILTQYDNRTKRNLTHGDGNTSSVALTTSFAKVYEFNVTTSNYTDSGVEDNIHLLLNSRITPSYTAGTANITTQIRLSDGQTCQNITRYGASGSSGSTGDSCIINNLNASTTYTVEVWGVSTVNANTLNTLRIHATELLLNPVMANDTRVASMNLTGTAATAIANITITNPLGGAYGVLIEASINAYNYNSTSQTARFWFSNSDNTSKVSRTLGTGSTIGNVKIQHVYDESGTGAQTYTLYGECSLGGCTIDSAEFVAVLSDQQGINTQNVTVYAYDFYNSTQLTGFNVTIGGATFTSSGTSITVPIDDNPETIIVSKTNYFSNTSSHDTTTTLNASLTPYTAVRATGASGGSISNFTILFNSTNYTTTNSVVYIPAYNDTYNITISDAYNGTTYFESKNASITANPYLHTYNFSLYFTNSFLFTFRNETTNELLNKTITIELISDSQTYNVTFTGGTYNATLLVPEDYEIIYYWDADVPRSYYVTLTNQSVQNITLYTIDANLSTYYLPIVEDPDGDRCSDVLVKMQRYYLDINAYRTVEMDKTNTQGEAVFRVQPNIIPYKFIFSGDCGTFTSQPSEITSTTDTYTVTDAQSVLTSFLLMPSVSTNLTYINATSTYVFTWTDDSNIVTQGCLYVTRRYKGETSSLNSTCTSGATGSVFITLTNTDNGTYWGRGELTTNTAYSEYSFGPLEIDFDELWENWGLTGLLVASLLVITVALFSTSSAATLVAGVVGAIAVAAYVNLIYAPWTSIIVLLAFGGVILYKMSR